MKTAEEFYNSKDPNMNDGRVRLSRPQVIAMLEEYAQQPAVSEKLVICPDCSGDGKETCHNPDHGFLSAVMNIKSANESACPGCGHNEESKVKNGGDCETCSGKGCVEKNVAECFMNDNQYNEEYEIDCSKLNNKDRLTFIQILNSGNVTIQSLNVQGEEEKPFTMDDWPEGLRKKFEAVKSDHEATIRNEGYTEGFEAGKSYNAQGEEIDCRSCKYLMNDSWECNKCDDTYCMWESPQEKGGEG